jgi:H+-transporting ATPase
MLVVPCEVTQIAGTFIVVYGLFMAPTGWRLALMVWGYAIVSFFIASAIKVETYRLLDHRAAHQARHLARIEEHLAA